MRNVIVENECNVIAYVFNQHSVNKCLPAMLSENSQYCNAPWDIDCAALHECHLSYTIMYNENVNNIGKKHSMTPTTNLAETTISRSLAVFNTSNNNNNQYYIVVYTRTTIPMN